MLTTFDRLFRAHPRSVDESYLQHFFFALRFSGRLFAAAGAALVHALLPFLCATTASNAVMDIHDEIAGRRRLAKTGAHNDAPIADPEQQLAG